MQAVIFGMFGISELQRRNASPVHIDWASALKAKPEVEVTAENEAAMASAKPALRTVFVKKIGATLVTPRAGESLICGNRTKVMT